jgi:hypothetical protein
MGELRVETDGLQTLARECESWATEVEAGKLVNTVRPSFQATADAVRGTQTLTRTIMSSLADSLRSTASHLQSAAFQYSTADGSSAVLIHDARAT